MHVYDNSTVANWTLTGLMLTLATMAATVHAEEKPSETNPISIAQVKHEGPVDFEKEILPILRRNCLACHNKADAESDLVLETPQTILQGGVEGPAVVAGKGVESLLLKLAAHQLEPIMPPEDNDRGAKSLTPEELGLVKLWIDQGAAGEVHSASGPPQWQPLPPGVNPIYAVAVSPHGKYVAGSRANQIFLYQVYTKKLITRLTDPALVKQAAPSKVGLAHLDLVHSLAFSPDGTMLASGGYRTIKLWQRQHNLRLGELAGAESLIRTIATSSDGKWLATGEENGKIKVFDLATRKLANTLAGHTGAVTAVQFSTDSTKLVSGSLDKSLRLWSIADGKPLASIETPAQVNAITLLQGDTQLASGGADNLVRIWTVATQKDTKPPVWQITPGRELAGHTKPVTSLATVNKTQIISGSLDGTVRHWDVAGGKQLRQMKHGGPVTAVAVRPGAGRFASASENKTAKLWNAGDGKQVAELRGDHRTKLHAEDVGRAVALLKRRLDNAKKDLEAANKRNKQEAENAKKSEEARKKAEEELKKKVEATKKPLAEKQAADKGLVAAKAEQTKAQEAHKAADAAAKQAGEALKKAAAACDVDNTEETKKSLAEAEAKKKAADQTLEKANEALKQAQSKFKQAEENAKKKAGPAQKSTNEKNAAEKTLKSATRSVERAKQAVKKATDAIPPVEQARKQEEEAHKQRETAQKEAKQAADQSEKPIRAIAFSPDGAQLATVGDDQQVYTWSAESGVPLDVFSGQGSPLTAVVYTTQGNLICAGKNHSLLLWDTRPQWKLVRTIGSADSVEHFLDRVTALHFSPDGKTLATGGGDPSRSGELKLWNVQDGKLLRQIPDAHSDTILGLEFSPNGKYLASCAADRFMKVFDAASGKLIKTFEGHTHHVLGVTWRADGRMLASCGADRVIKVWNFRTGDRARNIGGFGKEVTSIQFVSNSDNVIAASGDKTVTMRNTSNGKTEGGFGGATDFVYATRASADSKTVVAGGQDSVLRVWNGSDKKSIVEFKPPEKPTTNGQQNKQAAK